MRSGSRPEVGVIDWFAPETLGRFTQTGAYPTDPTAGRGAAWIQTHLSHLFLTEGRVYKLRKPVDLGFVDFTTREERNADCVREVSLNRRLARDVYLGVAPLLTDGRKCWAGPISGAANIGAGGLEHFVVMRRLRDDRDALSLLQNGVLSGFQIDRVARCIANFHEHNHLGKPAPFTAAEWYARCVDPIEDCFRALLAASEDRDLRGELAESADVIRDFVKRHAQRFEERRLAGRAVDGHGDLHLQHIWFENDCDDPVIIDCLEFSEELRQIDTASEVAFTAMDLRYRDRQDLADRFLRTYASERDDFDLYGVVDYFIAYRALVRAKVAMLTSVDANIDAGQRAGAAASAGRHLKLAGEVMGNRRPGSLVLVGGVVGTGKSTVADALAEQIGGVVISSDRVRKQLARLPPSSRVRALPDEGFYAPGAVERTYAALSERARPIVNSGRVAILDATFSRRRHRAMAAELAADLGVAQRMIEVRCAPEIARERLARREAQGSSASDAGPAFYERSVARFEPVDDSERSYVLCTDGVGWRSALEGLIHELQI
jgi:aminoglycoside phosphotransferase family enzyme/predicted kinase